MDAMTPSPFREYNRRFWGALGSLKLTVALLGASIFLVFVGTLAQVDRGIWTVVDQYFRCWIAQVEFKIFFPRDSGVIGWLPFPGGKLLGGLLVVNLLVAHAQRICLQARGMRLLLGIATTAVGAVLTWLVISQVFDADSTQRKISPAWRVTLQILQGGGVALILFFGCKLLFDRKAGIVLLHAGVVLMMTTELIADSLAEEGRMSITEGQSTNYVEDTRKVEVAIIDPSDPREDTVVAVPEGMLRKGETLRAPELPFEIEVVRFMKNSGLRRPTASDENPATDGSGLQMIAVERGEESGVSSAGRVDIPAAYLKFRDRGGAALGTYLVGVELTLNDTQERVRAGGKTYDVSLRFKRTYKPYELYLHDFRFERYQGTDTPKDYSSYVRLTDRERNTERDVRIWMNNPLRYRDDTLYQADFDKETETTTILQVVTNSGWMVPYVACMIVAAGLLGQFGLHLLEFLRKRWAA